MATVRYPPSCESLEEELELLSAFILIRNPCVRRTVIEMTRALVPRARDRHPEGRVQVVGNEARRPGLLERGSPKLPTEA